MWGYFLESAIMCSRAITGLWAMTGGSHRSGGTPWPPLTPKCHLVRQYIMYMQHIQGLFGSNNLRHGNAVAVGLMAAASC